MRLPIAALLLVAGAVPAPALAQQPPPPGGRGSLQSTAPPPAPLVASGLIVGRVIDPATGRGVPGATVMISGGVRAVPMPVQPGAPRPTPPPPPPRYLTDGEGRFAFRQLTRGSYVISATRPGYADGAHGRLRPNGPTRPVLLDDGERVGEVLIRLFKHGAISGTVVDEAGEPVVGVSIRAYRRVLMAGRRVFAPFGGNVVTDDRGMYRLSNLTPGEFVLSVPMVSTTMPNGFTPDTRASPNFESTMFLPNSTGLSFGSGRQVTPDGRFLLQTGSSSSTNAGAFVEADGRLRTSPTMFYPSARAVAEAQVVALGSGEERGGVDIVLPLVAASSVSGQLVSPEGPAAGYALHLVAADDGGLSVDQPVASAVTAPDGSFMFLAVPAGQYVLQTTRVPRPAPPPPPPPPPPPGAAGGVAGSIIAPIRVQARPSGPLLWASMPIALGDADIDGLVVMLKEGLTVSGRVEFDGTAQRPPPARLAQVPVFLEPADGRQRANSGPARPQPDGRFTTTGMLPGKYFLRIGGTPPGWVFRSAMLNGVDISDLPVTIDRDLDGVIVTFTDRPSELTGTVTVPSGSPADAAVVIFPADTTAWTEFGINARRLRMARPGQNGTFMFGSPPPGDYFIVAFREEYAVEWQDPAFLEQLSRVASRITLLEGERRTVDVAFHDVRPPGERYRESATGYREPSPRELADTTPDAVTTPDIVASGPFVPDEPAPEPQVRDRSVEAARPGTGVITGVVVLQADSSPVRRARVSVMSPETRTQRTAITDDAGRFAIASLPPGRYTLSVSKPAHLTSYHGSRIPGRGPGTPIELAAGQQVTGITMPIQRGGVVSGVVVDAFGQPYPGVRVRLMRFVMRDGDRTLQQIGAGGTGTTNDRGAYRLYGIMPGSYVVTVTAPVSTTTETLQLSAEDINAALSELQQSQTTSVTESGTQVSTTRRTIAPAPPGTVSQIPRSGRPLGYAAFFYPGTPMEHEAVPVTVAAGEELSGVDVPMQLVPTARIEGTLLAPDGQPATRASLTLMTTIAGATTSRSVRTLPNGRFQAIGVPPGRYTLTARMIQQPPRPPMPPGAPSPAPVALRTQGSQLAYWAQQELDINGEDVNDLSLTLAEAMTISGRVVFDARTEKPPVGAGAVRVALEPLAASRFGFSARPAGTDAAGNFTITGVTPGRYRLNATVIGGAPSSPIAASAGMTGPRWMMQSTAIDGRDFVDSPVEIRGGDHLTGVVIALTDQVTEISGAILDATGAPVPDLTVVLFPADRAAWTSGSRRLRPPIRSTDGRFRMTALPPGEYLLAVATEIDPGDWGDPAYMEQLAAAAIRISLAEGEKKVQNVRVGG